MFGGLSFELYGENAVFCPSNIYAAPGSLGDIGKVWKMIRGIKISIQASLDLFSQAGRFVV